MTRSSLAECPLEFPIVRWSSLFKLVAKSKVEHEKTFDGETSSGLHQDWLNVSPIFSPESTVYWTDYVTSTMDRVAYLAHG